MYVGNTTESNEYDYTHIVQPAIMEMLEDEQDPLPADRIIDLISVSDEEVSEFDPDSDYETPRMKLHLDWRWERLGGGTRSRVIRGILERLSTGAECVLDCVPMDYGTGLEQCYRLKKWANNRQAVDMS